MEEKRKKSRKRKSRKRNREKEIREKKIREKKFEKKKIAYDRCGLSKVTEKRKWSIIASLESCENMLRFFESSLLSWHFYKLLNATRIVCLIGTRNEIKTCS